MVAQEIFEIARIAWFEQVGPIDEEQERRRGVFDLGAVIDLGVGRAVLTRPPALDRQFKDLVDLGGGDALFRLGMQFDSELEDVVDVGTGQGAGECDRSVAQTGQAVAQPLQIFGPLCSARFSDVPLVDHDDCGLAFGLAEMSELLVDHAQFVAGIEHQQDHIGATDGPFGAAGRIEFDVFFDLGFLAQTSRVDQGEVAARVVDRHIDGVAGGAREVGDDDPFLTAQGVGQAAFADVAPAGEAELDAMIFDGIGRGRGADRGQALGQAFEQIVEAVGLGGADREGLAHPEIGELKDLAVESVVIDLVDREDDLVLDRTQAVGDLAIEGQHAVTAVGQEDDPVGGGDGPADLLINIGFELGFVDDADAAGVDQVKAQVVAADFMKKPVAGHARSGIDDGDGLADQPIEQRALAHIGPADDSDHGTHRMHLSTVSQACAFTASGRRHLRLPRDHRRRRRGWG